MLVPIAGSISEKSGIGSGDIIEKINGVVPKVPQDIINIIQKNTEVTVLIKR
jgi:C-terminal processing protease CtpA/Prc